MIKGITVTLYEKKETGTDPFGHSVYKEIPVSASLNSKLSGWNAASISCSCPQRLKRGQDIICLTR